MQKSLLQLIRIITRSHKNSSCFRNKTRVKGERVSQAAKALSEKLYAHKKKVFLSIILINNKKKNKVEKEHKINLAITAAKTVATNL